MSADCVLTGVPDFILTKEYEGKPKEEDLFEIFAVIYRVDERKGNWENTENNIEEGSDLRFVFFNNVAKAVARFKLFGPKRSLLKRILTDNKELWDAAEKNNHIEVELSETESESQSEETKEEIEENNKELEKQMEQLQT